jgi:hypothetical protein
LRGYAAMCSESGTSGEKFPRSGRLVQDAGVPEDLTDSSVVSAPVRVVGSFQPLRRVYKDLALVA